MPRGRKPKFAKNVVLSIRFEEEEYARVKDIAALEAATTGHPVSIHGLIRDAVNFVYRDNERLRECFRRSREPVTRKWN